MQITQLCRQNATNWAKLTLPLLKQECRQRGLKISGRKIDLISRLESFGNKSAQQKSTPQTKTAGTKQVIQAKPPKVTQVIKEIKTDSHVATAADGPQNKLSTLSYLQNDLNRLQKQALEMKGLMSVMVTSKDSAPKLNHMKLQLNNAQDQAVSLQNKIDSMKQLYHENKLVPLTEPVTEISKQTTIDSAGKDTTRGSKFKNIQNSSVWWYVLGSVIGGAWFLQDFQTVKAEDEPTIIIDTSETSYSPPETSTTTQSTSKLSKPSNAAENNEI